MVILLLDYAYRNGIGWIIFFICLIFTAATAAANFVSTILALLTIPLTRDNIVAKILNAIPFLLLGIDAVCMPWQLSIEYGFLQWVLGISLTITIAISFISMIWLPFNIDDHI